MVNGPDKSKKQLRQKGLPNGLPTSAFGMAWCLMLAVGLLLAGTYLVGCRQGGLLTKIVARVNGEEISLGEFERRMRGQMGYSSQGLGATVAEKTHIKQALLGRLIEEKLLLQEAKKKGMVLSPEVFSEHLSEIKSHFSGAEFGRHLSELGLSNREWEDLERDRLLVEKLVKAEIAGKIDITEEAVVAFYQGHRSEFKLPEQVKVRQIVVSTEAQAREVLKRVKAAKAGDFAQIAQETSVSPDKEKGGELKYYARGEMPVVFDRAFELRVGQTSEVIESDYGFHIFQLIDKKPARIQELEEVRGIIREKLRSRQEETLYSAYIEHLYRHARIQKSESLLDKI